MRRPSEEEICLMVVPQGFLGNGKRYEDIGMYEAFLGTGSVLDICGPLASHQGEAGKPFQLSLFS